MEKESPEGNPSNRIGISNMIETTKGSVKLPGLGRGGGIVNYMCEALGAKGRGEQMMKSVTQTL